MLIGTVISFSLSFNYVYQGYGANSTVGVDTSDVRNVEKLTISGRFRVYPTPIYSSPSGFGLKFGYELNQRPISQSRLLIQLLPAQHLGRYTISYYLKDPNRSGPYGIFNAYYEKTGRQWYYGIGPTSRSDAQVAVNVERLEFEARAGINLLRRTLRLQPFIRYAAYRIRDSRAFREGAFDNLNLYSLIHLQSVTQLSTDTRPSSLTYGLHLGIDTRDQLYLPRRGVLFQASGQRLEMDRPESSSIKTCQIHFYGFIPLRLNHIVSLRLVIIRAFSEGNIPFFLLPILDGEYAVGLPWNRFYGNDLLSFGIEYRFPILYFLNYIGFEGLVSIHLANVYDNILDQFSSGVTFDRDLSLSMDTIPLRPSLGFGGQIVSLYEDRIHIRGLIGISADGLTLVRFSFVRNLLDVSLGRR